VPTPTGQTDEQTPAGSFITFHKTQPAYYIYHKYNQNEVGIEKCASKCKKPKNGDFMERCGYIAA